MTNRTANPINSHQQTTPHGYRSFADIGDENHMLIHVTTSRDSTIAWRQYMHDLDDFFTRLFKYHQKSGFTCLICGQLLELVQIAYSVFLPIFFLNYVDYDVLFKNKQVQPSTPNAKVHIYDIIKPFKSVTVPKIQIFAIILASIFLVWKSIKTVLAIIVNSAIRQFYRDVLHVNDCSSLTWQDVQAKIISCRHNFLAQDSHLTELDVHQRILRHNNYMIALVNRGILPIYFKVPLIGETTFFTQSLLYNCQLLFFRGPFKCIFEENWLISEDVKNVAHRQTVAKKLDRNIMILAFINLLLFPVLLIWQILYFFYSNAALVKRDPVVLGLRNWSLYAKWFCRHFNELDHQLNERLNHAYKPARNYMEAFTSPLMEILARHVRFIAGSTFAILLLLTIYDENVIQVVHLLTVITGLWLVWSSASGFIPPEVPPRFTKIELYDQILQNIHYVPHNYPAFTPQAKSSMGDLFQYKITKLFEDLLSTIATPYIMVRHLRSRSLEIVDFFRNYTVEVLGTGDVCVFSMMNIKENGNPQWQPLLLSGHMSTDRSHAGGDEQARDKNLNKSQHHTYATDLDEPNSYQYTEPANVPLNVPQFERETLLNHAVPLQTEHGKLELSLINFKLQNPSWNPSNATQREFVHKVTSQAIEQASSRQMSHLSSCHEGEEQNTSSALANRARLANEPQDLDSSTAISLSTLFLHEHARLSTTFPSTSNSDSSQRVKPKSHEQDPLL